MVRFATELFVNMLSNSLAAIIRRGADEISLSTMAPVTEQPTRFITPGGLKTVQHSSGDLRTFLKAPPGTLKTFKIRKVYRNKDQKTSKV